MKTILAIAALAAAPLAALAQNQPRAVPLPPPPAGMTQAATPTAITTATTTPTATPTAENDTGALLLGVKAGGILPFSKLGANAAGAVEVGWVLPWMERSFAAVLEIAYAQPTASGGAGDPRVGGAAYDWKLTQRELVLAPTVLWRLQPLATWIGVPGLVPYAGFGPRAYLLQSRVSGSAGGQAMPTTTEQGLRFGAGAPLGAEYALGPGRLTGELLLEWGALDTRAAGSGTTTGGASLRVGYRMVF